MKKAEKQLFLDVIRARFVSEKPPSAAEIARIEDYVAQRGRILLLRKLMGKEVAELTAGSESSATKNLVASLSRQLDQAERQSHSLAEKLGLLSV